MTIAPEFMALQMPMMFRSDDEMNYVRDRLNPEFERLLKTRGFKLLTWGDAGWVHFFANRPVVQPDDLKPLRMWVWAGDAVTLQAWKDSGYRPVPLPVTEIHTGLASGLIGHVFGDARGRAVVPVVRPGQAHDRSEVGAADRRDHHVLACVEENS